MTYANPTLGEAVSKRVTSDEIACDTPVGLRSRHGRQAGQALPLQGTPNSDKSRAGVEVSLHRNLLRQRFGV
jgi:hypothetical protein